MDDEVVLPIDQYLFRLFHSGENVTVRLIDGTDFWNGAYIDMSCQDFKALQNIPSRPSAKYCKTHGTASYSLRAARADKNVWLRLIGRRAEIPITTDLYRGLSLGKGFEEVLLCAEHMLQTKCGREHEKTGAKGRNNLGCHRHIYNYSFLGKTNLPDDSDWFLTKDKCLEESFKCINWMRGEGVVIRRYYIRRRRFDRLIYDVLLVFCQAAKKYPDLPPPAFSWHYMRAYLHRLNDILDLGLNNQNIAIGSSCAIACVLACYKRPDLKLRLFFKTENFNSIKFSKPNPYYFVGQYYLYLIDEGLRMSFNDTSLQIRDLYHRAWGIDLGPQTLYVCAILGSLLRRAYAQENMQCADDWENFVETDWPLYQLAHDH